MNSDSGSKNIHVFRVNRLVRNKEQSPQQQKATSVNTRTSLSAETKRWICEDHINNPKYTQEALASKYGCKRTTVAKIIKSKERWLSIDSNAAVAKRYRQRSSRYPLVENALVLWLQNEQQHDLANVTDQMLRCQARQYAQTFSVEGLEDFKASSSWISNFKQRYLIPKLRMQKGNDSVTSSSNSSVSSIEDEEETPSFRKNVQKYTTVFSIAQSTESTQMEDTATGSSNKDKNGLIIQEWSVPQLKDKPTRQASLGSDNATKDQESMSDHDTMDYTDDFNPDHCFDNNDHFSSTESPLDSSNKEDSKLIAKRHLEAALDFYAGQNGGNASMSANMIKLILQNDF